MKELKKQFAEVCEEYLRRFCKKHEISYEEDSWVGGDVGTVAMVGDYFFGLDEIRYDIDHDCPEDAIFEWYDYTLRIHSLGCEKTINFKSWVKGAPLPYNEDDLEHIEKLSEDVERARQLLYDSIKDAENRNNHKG